MVRLKRLLGASIAGATLVLACGPLDKTYTFEGSSDGGADSATCTLPAATKDQAVACRDCLQKQCCADTAACIGVTACGDAVYCRCKSDAPSTLLGCPRACTNLKDVLSLYDPYFSCATNNCKLSCGL